MERSKTRLLTRDIASIKEVGGKDEKRAVEPNNSDDLQLYRIKRIGHPSRDHVSKPTSPPFAITTHHAIITPL